MSDMGEQQTAAPTEAPAPTQEAQQTTQAPPDPVMARLDEMSQQIGALSQTQPPAEQQQWQGGIADLPYMPEDGYQQQGYDQQFQQGYQDPNGYQPGQYQSDGYQDPQVAQQQAMEQLNQYIATQVQQATQPMIVEQKVKELERQYPELADPANAQKVFNEAVMYAKRMGNPEMARHPELIELVHLAQSARSNATQETPADGGNSVHLEGGGAAPTEPEMDAADRMLQAWGKGPTP